MKKFYLKNGEEVQLGDTICKEVETKSPFGESKVITHILITEEAIPYLISEGVITTKEYTAASTISVKEKEESKRSADLEFYISKIANRLGWKIEKVYNYLNTIDNIFPAAAFSIILREIAVELDRKYKDHIENSPDIYVVSMLDGRITRANKAHIKNYRNFSAFRSIEDAKTACKITKDILKDLFKSGK